MTESNARQFVIIAGRISNNKIKEFEQTFRLAASLMSGDCIDQHLSMDVMNEGFYHFFSVWKTEKALKRFMESDEFLVMNGAFRTLGSGTQIKLGSVSEL